jgi:hypothetical protein
MRRPALLLPLALLAACQSPREACIDNATRELRVMERLIAETRANITRGYAIREVQEIRTRPGRCTGTNADGSAFTFPCDQTDTITREVPVAIDLNAERAKLDSLLERQAQMRRTSEAQVQACIAAYPAE